VVLVEFPHHQYEITIESGALARVGAIVRALAPAGRCAVFSDAHVETHRAAVCESLRRADYEVVQAVVPSGEENKNLATVGSLYDVLLDARLERRSPLIAVGGGVTGDTAGFVAATYLRGLPFVQCPTTLLAMVDSSVGGKVGVNVPQGKNLIGAFHQPIAVIADPLVLRTLPARELRCGLAECIKHGVLGDESLFVFIEERLERILALDAPTIAELVRRNVEIKAAVVITDERESGVRAHLNLGHTFGHAVEATAGYGVLLHGEAVALGLIAAATVATRMRLCDPTVAPRIARLIERAGLPTRAALPADQVLLESMQLDKKVQAGRIRFVLPSRIGAVVLRDDVPAADIAAAWATIRA
jgi:3-dehydroquinate synthase